MSAPDALGTLRRHDPAAGLAPAEADACERLRRTIVAEPVPAPAGRKPRGRGRLVLVVAALALVLSAAAAWGVYTIAADSPEEVRRQLEQIKTTIPLPPGAAWDEPGLRDDSVYGRGMALTIALSQATCKWLRYWDEGDSARQADALSALRGIRALMPLHPEGAPEDVGGYDENTLRYMDDLIAGASRGDGTRVSEYLAANCA